MKRVKVLVVDDSAFYRQSIANILKKNSRFEVIGSAPNGSEAIRLMSRSKPDVITLDLEMPTMDGFTFLRWLMVNMPTPVVVISSRSEQENVLKSLELGAVDFVVKPAQRATLEILNLEAELVAKVETAASVPPDKIGLKRPPSTQKPAPPMGTAVEHRPSDALRIVAIGASTGGPPAIQSIITKLPGNFQPSIVISQHMPPGFTLYFAERLSKAGNIPVKEGAAGDRLESGTVYIAPGGHHMLFRRTKNGVEIALKARGDSDKYTPSVDQMMISAAEVYGPNVLGILLTGMGSDGRSGMKSIKESGGGTVAEAEETSIVFGMPKEAISSGVVDTVLPLYKIPDEIIRRCS